MDFEFILPSVGFCTQPERAGKASRQRVIVHVARVVESRTVWQYSFGKMILADGFGSDFGRRFRKTVLEDDFGRRFWKTILADDFGRRVGRLPINYLVCAVLDNYV